ncbi:hypothetical protein [Caldovatus aquaticus]|uniref:Uncharacterized protein n=1 Tax=Caldovatus aquaticus TaxID=2865671 RepID=A0ABS7EZ10_9PROT|nr:hypothetical protein [Caldovatus aquaticus]MBW8268318.1 hypothetical protein [Caldovatus aquaticus]
MSDRPPSDQPPPRPPCGPTWDCAFCRHWQPGAVVLRGNSLGACRALEQITAADFGCGLFAFRPKENPDAHARETAE